MKTIDIERLTIIIKSCYKKFKSYVYYSNYTYLKRKIIEFEFNDNFEGIFNVLGTALSNNSDEYFNQLIQQINWIPQIKKIHNKENNDVLIISNQIDNSKVIVEKINYFIDMPIELYILDVLWTILFGKCLYDSKLIESSNAANKFAYGLFSNKTGIDGIDFDSINLFEPYYFNYKKWRKGAIDKVNELYNNKVDSTIIALDLTEYFYGVDINFNEINEFIKYFDIDFSYLTKIIENIHIIYSNQLRQIKNNISTDKVLPIGLCSSNVLANYYLNEFDKEILNTNNVEYYSRYVDDMLLVVPKISDKDKTTDIIDELLPNHFIKDAKNIYLKSKPNCKIQDGKIKIIKIYADGSNSLIKSLEEEVPNPSEANLIPGEVCSRLEVLSTFIFNNKTESLKIRESEDLKLSKYKLMQFMSGYISFKRNTTPRTISANMINEIKNVFSVSNLFNLSDKWNKIFEFVYLAIGSAELTKELVTRIETYIKDLKLDDNIGIYQPRTNEVLIRIKENLLNNLCYCFGSVLSVNLNDFKDLDIFETATPLSHKIKHSNLFNHTLVSLPLINYLKDEYLENVNLYDINNLDKTLFNKDVNNIIDENKIEYSPRFVHLDEYIMFRYFMSIDMLNIEALNEKIVDEYFKYFKVSDFNSISRGDLSDNIGDNKYIINNYVITSDDILDLECVFVGLANVNLESQEIFIEDKVNLDDSKFKTIEEKKELFKLLNECLNAKHKLAKNNRMPMFLVFPELYIPLEWLSYLSYFSRKNDIAIITGVKYVKYGDKLINSICTIIPFSKNKYKYSSLFIREKNDYAPNEIITIDNTPGFKFEPVEKQLYDLFEWNNVRFTVFDCYELTDVSARSKFKNNIDIMFSIEYNQDTSYFSNIVESTTRDLGCFVVQVNTSNYGDTRIVGPCKRNYLNICSISGGEINSIHVGKVCLNDYRDYKVYEREPEFKEHKKHVEQSTKEKLIKKFARSSAKVE